MLLTRVLTIFKNNKTMGEYLHNVKLGTCESLYYTTFDQLNNWQVSGKHEFLKINSGYRFRFPFPDEKRPIGDYSDFDRGYLIELPKGVFEMEHGKKFVRTDSQLQIKAPAIGFYVACPTKIEGRRRWEHEETESYEIVQQKYVTDEETGEPMLQTALRCPYCGNIARASLTEANKIAEHLVKVGKDLQGRDNQKGLELIQIANIIIEGYLRFKDQWKSITV
jgi:hypothetical protein